MLLLLQLCFSSFYIVYLSCCLNPRDVTNFYQIYQLPLDTSIWVAKLFVTRPSQFFIANNPDRFQLFTTGEQCSRLLQQVTSREWPIAMCPSKGRTKTPKPWQHKEQTRRRSRISWTLSSGKRWTWGRNLWVDRRGHWCVLMGSKSPPLASLILWRWNWTINFNQNFPWFSGTLGRPGFCMQDALPLCLVCQTPSGRRSCPCSHDNPLAVRNAKPNTMNPVYSVQPWGT